jgi:hypothetical protein
MRFIKLTEYFQESSRSVFIALGSISQISRNDPRYTTIYLDSGEYVRVVEMPEDILKRLEAEIL